MDDIVRTYISYKKELKALQKNIQAFESSKNKELIMSSHTLKNEANKLKIVIDALEEKIYKLGCVNCVFAKATNEPNLYKCTIGIEHNVCGETPICIDFVSNKSEV